MIQKSLLLLSLIGACLVQISPARGDSADLLKSIRDRVAVKESSGKVFNSCTKDEDTYLTIERQVLLPWQDAWIHRDASAFQSLTADNWQTFDWSASAEKPWRSRGGIDELRREFSAKAPLLETAQARAEITRYLAAFQKIDDVSVDTVQVAFRDAGKTAWLKSRLDVRGITQSGWRRNDRAVMNLTLTNQSGTWKLVSARTDRLDTLQTPKALFETATNTSGMSAAPVELRTEAIRRGGYALAIGDIDGDGHADMVVGTRDGLTLWKGDGHGHFRELKDPVLNQEKLVKTAILADLDNDGKPDLLLTKFMPASAGEDIVLFHNEGGGKFKKVDGPLTGRLPSDYAMPATVADFNGDGRLDLYVGFPGNRDFTFLASPEAVPYRGIAEQGLFINEGKLSFRDVTRSARLTDLPEQPAIMRKLFPHSALAFDYDGDHRPDIVVIDDRGNLSPLFHNNGDGTFTQVADTIGVGNHSVGMGAAVGSMTNDGRLDLVMTSVDFLAGARLASCMGGMTGNAPMTGRGLRAFKNYGGGKFVEVTDVAGLDWAGEGAGGVEFVDYDNDGYQDIVVTNGLWSGTSRDQAMASYFVRGVEQGVDQKSINGLPNPSSRSDFMEVLASFMGDALTGKKSEGTSVERPSMGGFQHKRLFRNNRDGTYTEIGYLAGIDSVSDGYIVAKADLDEDGKMDLIFRNADPGTETTKFPVVEVFRNQASPENHSLLVYLEGSPENHSSRDAISAEVTVRTGKSRQFQALMANNGAAQSERVLHFGLGTRKRADLVEVRWPSGKIQKLRDVPAGRIHLREETERGIASASR